MKILSIETSCDETGIAVIQGEKTSDGFTFTTLGSALLSQASLHAEYGGVYPNLAKREHEKNLPTILSEALKIAELCGTDADGRGKDPFQNIDAIAVTSGPGLEPALWTGIEFAKRLAAERGKPLFGVNHMEGHIISSLAQPVEDGKTNHSSFLQKARMMYELKDVQMPILALLVSGGHTEFVLMRDWFSYELIGRTLDDAVGEAFDKVARMLGLPYPGGPHISALAEMSRKNAEHTRNDAEKIPHESASVLHSSALSLPRPMIHADTCDMSFSGLKTAALYALRDVGGIQTRSADQIAEFAREFEDSIGDVLTEKSRRALEQTGAATFVIGGGVAANFYLREKLHALVSNEFPDVEFRLPHLAITGDNAVMIGQAALAHLLTNNWQLITDNKLEIRAQGNLSLA